MGFTEKDVFEAEPLIKMISGPIDIVMVENRTIYRNHNTRKYAEHLGDVMYV